MKKTASVRTGCVLLALLFLFLCVSCSEKRDEKSVDVTGTFTVGLVSEPFTDRFASASANILRAGNDTDYAAGLLCSEPILSGQPDGSFTERNGSISVDNGGSVTVATVRIKKNMEYYTGQTVFISDYIGLMQQICLYSYDGYFKDYYKYPIEGLVAYRFKKRGLTLSDLPDFDAQTREVIASLDATSYKDLLIKTSIAGLYDGNASALNYDGKTFRETIERETSDLPAGYFTNTPKEEILKRLAEILSARPQNEWIRDLLYSHVYEGIVSDYRASLEALKDNPGSISGVVRIDDYSCKVTFEKKIDENEAKRILNLPLIYPNGSRRMGAYNFRHSASGTVGKALSFNTKKLESLTVLTVSAEAAVDSVMLRELSAAFFFGRLSEKDEAKAKDAGLTVEQIGRGYAVYDASVTDAGFLRSLALFC